ncbi:glycosyltransferase family 4 protein [Pseudotamlana agarivorans]|uniref:glycosyltransferase family 4 protein n=1 Tax=Pseudotamlana agarivorans TaxID=481183 RepID=UPI00082E3774|nr:glycosyltransferase family 4 protein [Tamlana agarivorans]
MNKKIIRITTVPTSLGILLKGQLNFMSKYYEVLGVSSSGANNELESVSLQEKVPVIPIEMTRKITPIKDLLAVWELYKLFKKEQPFIVHSHTPKAGTLSMIASKLAGTPHRLHTIAGLPLVEAKGLKRILLNSVEKLTYSCATKIYPNSVGLKNIILKHKFTRLEKLKVIANGSSNGIETAYFNPSLFDNEFIQNFRKELNINEDDFVFVFAGRLVKDKGVNELVSAYNKLKKPNVKLLLIGTYENELDPLHIDTKMAIENNNTIITPGWVNDVRPYFAISNALTFPSYREGFPNTVMQAAAMQIPCIVTDINGCNEIIKEGETGIIIPTKSTDALYDAMVYMLNNQKEAKQMGLLSRQLMISKFERKEVWNALLQEYNQL